MSNDPNQPGNPQGMDPGNLMLLRTLQASNDAASGAAPRYNGTSIYDNAYRSTYESAAQQRRAEASRSAPAISHAPSSSYGHSPASAPVYYPSGGGSYHRPSLLDRVLGIPPLSWIVALVRFAFKLVWLLLKLAVAIVLIALAVYVLKDDHASSRSSAPAQPTPLTSPQVQPPQGFAEPAAPVAEPTPLPAAPPIADPSPAAAAAPPRPRIGVSYRDLTPSDRARLALSPAQTGALVEQVEAGGPAARAGLFPGDVIIGINGSAVNRGEDLPQVVGAQRLDVAAPITVLRGGPNPLTIWVAPRLM